MASPLKRSFSALLALAATLCLASSAVAQAGYQGDEVDQRLSRKGSVVKRWVARPSGSADDAKLYKEYFAGYYFPAMTQPTTEGLAELGTLRYNLFRQYITAAAPEIQRGLTEQAYQFARRVIRGRGPDDAPRRYHRAVKYNAVLILGDLGSAYPRDGVRPMPQANEFLSQIAALGAQKKLPAYMLAGALVGLTKHAGSLDQLPQGNQEKTVAALVAATKPDAVADTAGRLTRDWLRRRAAAGLATASKTLNDPKLVAALVPLVEDASLTLDTRATIAASLVDLTLPENGAAAKAVLQLASEIGADEADMAEEFDDLKTGGGGMRETSHLMTSSRYRFDMTRSEMVFIRTGATARLSDLQAGLEAAGKAPGPHAAAIQTALSAVAQAIAKLTDEENIDLDVSEELIAMASTLAKTSPADAAAAEEAETDPAEEAEGLF